MNLQEPLIAPQPTPNVDELAAALAAYRDANREARAQLAAVTAERDALRAALASLLALSDDIEAELERTGAINDSGLPPASETEPYRIARAAINQ